MDFVHCKQYCKTFSVLSYRVSTVPPVVNSKGKKNLFAFYWNAFECEHYCTCGHTVPNQEMYCQNGGLHVLHANTCKTET